MGKANSSDKKIKQNRKVSGITESRPRPIREIVSEDEESLAYQAVLSFEMNKRSNRNIITRTNIVFFLSSNPHNLPSIKLSLCILL